MSAIASRVIVRNTRNQPLTVSREYDRRTVFVLLRLLPRFSDVHPRSTALSIHRCTSVGNSAS